MDNKRELIKKIKADSTISEPEKNKKIQELMMGNYLSSQSQSKSNESKTCSHYKKSCCKFYFDCCNVYDPCKRCHGERNCTSKDNLIVTKITCSNSECGIAQEPSELCIGCGIKFSNSFCSICQIWTSNEITHCVRCGICRLGKPETLFHCDDCGVCFNKPVRNGDETHENNTHENNTHENDTYKNNTHKCIEKKSQNANINLGYRDGICVVCSENTFNSQSESFPLNCGHFIHSGCFNQYIQQGLYKCPYCKKSIGDLNIHWNFIRNQIKIHPLPNDFIPIQLDDIVDTKYGKFVIITIKIISGEPMYTGKFLNWDIGNIENINTTKAYGVLNSNSVKKNLYKQIHCNDCGKKSSTIYHPYGLECVQCGSFNTQE
jgi:RING finger/CHY zinc finger protein 1